MPKPYTADTNTTSTSPTFALMIFMSDLKVVGGEGGSGKSEGCTFPGKSPTYYKTFDARVLKIEALLRRGFHNYQSKIQVTNVGSQGVDLAFRVTLFLHPTHILTKTLFQFEISLNLVRSKDKNIGLI